MHRPPKPSLFPYTTLFRSQQVAVISETTAQRFFPNSSPIGRRFGRLPERSEQFEIIGVVKDAKDMSLTEEWRSEEHTSELQSLRHLVCRLLLEKKKKKDTM